ncbi:hypothetical protein ACYJ1Y_08210 [Natrialbaceae archaeon A-gly3]
MSDVLKLAGMGLLALIGFVVILEIVGIILGIVSWIVSVLVSLVVLAIVGYLVYLGFTRLTGPSGSQPRSEWR